MTTNSVAVQVPEALYRRLERLATLTNRPVERVLAQTLTSGLPPLPDDLPATMRDALANLESLADAALERVVRERMDVTEVERFEILRQQRRAGSITRSEAQQLTDLTTTADLLTLRKADAAVLLKWRGRRVPTLADLAA
jgi:hypothetical protein